MLTPDSLTPEVAGELLGLAARNVQVAFLRPENHTWRIRAGDSAWYVKAHTKSWYGGDPESAAGTVRHEASAHRFLSESGLPTPAIATASSTSANPLGWPYLLTEELPGASLIDLLAELDYPQADRVLYRVGQHLAAMHALQFEHAGYLTDGPPTARPDPAGYQHPIWRFERFLTDAIRTWADDASEVPAAVMDRLTILIAETIEPARAAFTPPRFTHGDCHANGFFLNRSGTDWAVTGVLDMEVASAGCPAFDFTKLFIELTGHLTGAKYHWWEPLFSGYGSAPDFNLTRLHLASAGHINYTCLGEHAWPGSRSEILRHILAATNWEELFNPTPVTNGPRSAG